MDNRKLEIAYLGYFMKFRLGVWFSIFCVTIPKNPRTLNEQTYQMLNILENTHFLHDFLV